MVMCSFGRSKVGTLVMTHVFERPCHVPLDAADKLHICTRTQKRFLTCTMMLLILPPTSSSLSLLSLERDPERTNRRPIFVAWYMV